MPFREIIRPPEFESDMKKLLKRFRSLEADLDNFIKIELKLFHKLGIDNKGGQKLLATWTSKRWASAFANSSLKTLSRAGSPSITPSITFSLLSP